MLQAYQPLANPEWLMASSMATAIAPPAAPDFTAWARRNIVFGEESQFPGPYDPARFPYFARILEVLSPDHPCRTVTLMGSAQIGKTVLCQIFVGGTLDLDPCQLIYYHPTEGNAKEWARLKWRPMLRRSSALTDLLGGMKSRDATGSMLYYERADGRGSLTVAGSNSGAGVSMKSARVQIQDDLAKWETLPTGDSETQANSRSKAFLFAKIFKVSTPQLEQNCRITRNYKSGTQEHWHVPCPHCETPQELAWENMLAALGEDPDPDDAHFTCVACGARIEERHRDWMNANAVRLGGGWIAHNPGAHDISFAVWSIYSALEAWSNVVRAWISAAGIPASEQAFFNDVLGRPFKGADESPPFESIRDRAAAGGHQLGIIPAGGLLLVAGADCQKDRVEVHLKAFGPDGRRWTIEYRVIPGHISSEEARGALDALLNETWPDAYGNLRRIVMLAIDGNAWTTDVLAWCRRHPWTRVIATRGAKSDTAPPLVPVQSERKLDGRTKRVQKRFYNLGVSPLKSTLYKALAIDDPQRRAFCGYPKGLEDEFYRQLCAERREAKHGRDGFTTYRWTKDATQANEVLDTELIAEGAAIRCGWRGWTAKFAAELEGQLIASGSVVGAGANGQTELFDPARSANRAAEQPGPDHPEANAVRTATPSPDQPNKPARHADPTRPRGWLGGRGRRR